MIDFTKIKKLTIGGVELKKLLINGIQVWKAFTNWVPISEDTTPGSIFNGTGYIENRRLSSSGGLSSSAQNGAVTTGFIPWYGDTTVLRLKGVEWINAQPNYGGHFYIVFYDANKKVIDTGNNRLESPQTGTSHILTMTRDSNGVETFVFNQSYGTTNTLLQNVRKSAFIRITAYGKGADFIVTLNEEIT